MIAHVAIISSKTTIKLITIMLIISICIYVYIYIYTKGPGTRAPARTAASPPATPYTLMYVCTYIYI